MMPRAVERALLQNAINAKRMTAAELISLCGSSDNVRQYLFMLQKLGLIENAVREYTMPQGLNTNIAYTIKPAGLMRLQELSKSRIYSIALKLVLSLCGLLCVVFSDVLKDCFLRLLERYLGV